MDLNFQKTIALIAFLLLIIIYIIYIISLKYNKSSSSNSFPEIIADCPDYWNANVENGINVCNNIKNLGKMEDTSCPTTMNFNIFPFNTAKGNCYKADWANKCNLTWDGITNNSNKTCS